MASSVRLPKRRGLQAAPQVGGSPADSGAGSGSLPATAYTEPGRNRSGSAGARSMETHSKNTFKKGNSCSSDSGATNDISSGRDQTTTTATATNSQHKQSHNIIDHLVIAADSFFSFREHGLIG